MYLAAITRLTERFNAGITRPVSGERQLAGVDDSLDRAAEHHAACRCLMARPCREGRGLVGAAREDGVRPIAAAVGWDLPAAPGLNGALRGWTGLSERTTRTWLGTPDVPRGGVRSMVVDAPRALLASRVLPER